MRDPGAVEQIGLPLDLYDRPGNLFVASFLGSPAMNFLPGKLSAEATVVSQDGAVIVSPQKLIARPGAQEDDFWFPSGGGRPDRIRRCGCASE